VKSIGDFNLRPEPARIFYPVTFLSLQHLICMRRVAISAIVMGESFPPADVKIWAI
jgi:hypothetical protein